MIFHYSVYVVSKKVLNMDEEDLFPNDDFHNAHVVFYRRVGERKFIKIAWKRERIWKHTENKIAVDIPIEQFESIIKYSNKYYGDTEEERLRIEKAELKYPVICQLYANELLIIDGTHRIRKAKQLGMISVSTIIVKDFPEPDIVDEIAFAVVGLTYPYKGEIISVEKEMENDSTSQ